MDRKVIQLCNSLGKPCGIATYTEMLCQGQGLHAVSKIDDIESPPEYLHVQHEFAIVTLQTLRNIIKYCQINNVKFYITMHSVVAVANYPQQNFYKYFLLSFFYQIGAALANFVIKLDSLIWKDEYKIYNFIRQLKISIIKKLNSSIKRTAACNPENMRTQDGWISDPKRFPPNYILFLIKSERLIINNADKIIVHSERAKKTLIDMGAKNVGVVPHALNLYPVSHKRHSEGDGKLHIGCFGFLVKYKSFFEIIYACDALDNVVLHILASTGHESIKHNDPYLISLLKEIKSRPWIKLETKHLPLDQIVYQLSMNDVNVWYTRPPNQISTSGSIRQYLAAQRPIITSNNVMVYDIKDLVQMVPENNSQALAEALRNYKTDTHAMKEYIKTHTWDLIRTNYC